MITNLKQLPPDLQEMCRLLQQRDDSNLDDVLDQLNNALDDLRTADFDSFDESEFMQDHFGLEPDYFPSILDLSTNVS